MGAASASEKRNKADPWWKKIKVKNIRKAWESLLPKHLYMGEGGRKGRKREWERINKEKENWKRQKTGEITWQQVEFRWRELGRMRQRANPFGPLGQVCILNACGLTSLTHQARTSVFFSLTSGGLEVLWLQRTDGGLCWTLAATACLSQRVFRSQNLPSLYSKQSSASHYPNLSVLAT